MGGEKVASVSTVEAFKGFYSIHFKKNSSVALMIQVVGQGGYRFKGRYL